MIVPAQARTEITRETFWGISPVEEVLFYYLAVLTIAVFLVGVYRRFARYAAGTEDPIERLDALGRRTLVATKLVLTNEKQFDRDLYAGLMHAFVVWGFLTLLLATMILFIDLDVWVLLLGQESFYVGDFYLAYQFVVDAMGLLFVIGVGMALFRRYWTRNHRLWGKHTGFEDDAFVWTLFLLGVGGFVLEGLRILGNEYPSFEIVSFVGWATARGFEALGVTPALAASLHWWVWWTHAILALVFVAWIPYAKPFHLVSSYANVITRDEQAGRRLPRVPADAGPDEIGFTGVEDFSWKHVLDQDACTKCGRCSAVCPAKASGRPLDPRDVILDLKAYREAVEAGEREERPMIASGGTGEARAARAVTADGGALARSGSGDDGGGRSSESTDAGPVIPAETMESCMACMACMDACPVEIEHLTTFTELNRRLTETGQLDEAVQGVLMNVFQQGNAFGDPARKRPDWVDDLDFEVPDARDEPVEFLWYVGDYPSYDDLNRRVARALATLLDASGVSYGILYDDEKHDGNDVRRVGEEGLFEMLVEDNAAAIGECDFSTIVCTDPHSYNTFKHEYPEFDACDWTEGDVLHYTELVERLVDDGMIRLAGAELDYTVTYHDPCHLGRFNGVYEAPRALIEATGCELAEMPRNRENSFCCGGGGGGIWMDFDDDPKPSEERLREALEDTAVGDAVEKFVVACPQCNTMYEDGRKTGDFEERIEVVDLSELLAEAIGEAERPAV